MPEPNEVRKGRQTPTVAHIMPYESSRGAEAVALYNSTGKVAQEWQELLLYDILAYNQEGLWSHVKFGYSVPRRNGKNEVVAMRELWGLAHGEQILHTAHRTDTSHIAWERLEMLVEKAGLKVESTYRAYGKEHLYIEGGGRIEFRTRTSKGGLGSGYDLLIIDEAQEYLTDQESTLKYVVSSSQNPQTLMLGTPPTPVSSGTVFVEYRRDVLAGKTEDCGWCEWSIPNACDINDKEAWYECNPSLGTVLTERTIKTEIGGDEADFLIQRLGLWMKYNLKSAISQAEWEEVKVVNAEITGNVCVGIKQAVDGMSISMSLACKTSDGRTYIEGIGCHNAREGVGWIVEFLRSITTVTTKVCVDGRSSEELIVKAMKDSGLKKQPYILNTKDYITANAMLEPMLENKSICHSDQPAMTQAATNCEHRAVGTGGGYAYKSIKDGVDITILDSAVIAAWALEAFKPKQVKQRVYM